MRRGVKATNPKRSETKTLLKKAAVGAAGGLVASWLMNVFQDQAMRVLDEEDSPALTEEPAPAKIAEKAAKLVGTEFDEEDLEKAGPIVHYLFGATVGAIYGLLEDRIPFHGILSGVAYGTAVWLLADEIAVPSLKLAQGPTKYPVTTHMRALGAHIIYGAGLNAFSRGYQRLNA